MEEKLVKYLEHIEKLITGLIELAQRQQEAMIYLDYKELEQITDYQNALSKNLRETEQQRIKFLMNTFNISLKDASVLPLSIIEKKLKSTLIGEYRIKLNILTKQLNTLNIANRMLARRASNSVKEMFNIFSSGSNHVCNVKV